MYNNYLMKLVGRKVEVTADGMLYRGELIEISETDIFLKGEVGWVQLPVEKVTGIKEA